MNFIKQTWARGLLVACLVGNLCACGSQGGPSVQRLVMLRTTPAPLNASPLQPREYLLTVANSLTEIGLSLQTFGAQLIEVDKHPTLISETIWRNDRARELAIVRTNAELMKSLLPPSVYSDTQKQVVIAADAALALVDACVKALDEYRRTNLDQCGAASTKAGTLFAALEP